MKISPPAVATIPLRVGWYVPVFLIPFAASDGTTPSGTCHLIVPSFRSYAVNSAHGGPIAGSPLFALSVPYGVKYRTCPSGGCVAGAPPRPAGGVPAVGLL